MSFLCRTEFSSKICMSAIVAISKPSLHFQAKYSRSLILRRKVAQRKADLNFERQITFFQSSLFSLLCFLMTSLQAVAPGPCPCSRGCTVGYVALKKGRTLGGTKTKGMDEEQKENNEGERKRNKSIAITVGRWRTETLS